MTWKQARQEVQNNTGLSDLVLLQSKSTKDIGNISCDCTNVNFAHRCFFGCFVVMEGNGCGDQKRFSMILSSFMTLTKQKNNKMQQLCFSCVLLAWCFKAEKRLCMVADVPYNHWLPPINHGHCNVHWL